MLHTSQLQRVVLLHAGVLPCAGTDVAVLGSAAEGQSWVGRASLGPVGADGALQAHPGTYSLSGTCNLLDGSIVVGRPDLRMLRVRAQL